MKEILMEIIHLLKQAIFFEGFGGGVSDGCNVLLNGFMPGCLLFLNHGLSGLHGRHGFLNHGLSG